MVDNCKLALVDAVVEMIPGPMLVTAEKQQKIRVFVRVGSSYDEAVAVQTSKAYLMHLMMA